MSAERVDLTPLERVRMAVSDCGYDPKLVEEGKADDIVVVPWTWPREITWAARLLAFPDNLPICFACFVHGARSCSSDDMDAAEDLCESDRLFHRDCGVAR